MEHGTSLYNEVLRVPLIVLAPGYTGGRVIDDDVSLLDVAPTLLEMVGRPNEPRFEGRSLVPLLRGAAVGPKDVVAELASTGNDMFPTPFGTVDFGRHWAGVVRGPLKLLLRRPPPTIGPVASLGRLELYDLKQDPGERQPLPLVRSPEVDDLLRRLRVVKARVAHRSLEPAERVPLDEKTRERLRALGYVN
jgi:arylsulfatase A-like enzyme